MAQRCRRTLSGETVGFFAARKLIEAFGILMQAERVFGYFLARSNKEKSGAYSI
jgi:hypothetical protein